MSRDLGSDLSFYEYSGKVQANKNSKSTKYFSSFDKGFNYIGKLKGIWTSI